MFVCLTRGCPDTPISRHSANLELVVHPTIPSGNLTSIENDHLEWLFPIEMVLFHVVMLVYQKVNPIKSHEKTPCFYGFPMVFLWFSYGVPIFSSFSYAFPRCFSLNHHFPMVFLWFSSAQSRMLQKFCKSQVQPGSPVTGNCTPPTQRNLRAIELMINDG